MERTIEDHNKEIKYWYKKFLELNDMVMKRFGENQKDDQELGEAAITYDEYIDFQTELGMIVWVKEGQSIEEALKKLEEQRRVQN